MHSIAESNHPNHVSCPNLDDRHVDACRDGRLDVEVRFPSPRTLRRERHNAAGRFQEPRRLVLDALGDEERAERRDCQNDERRAS